MTPDEAITEVERLRARFNGLAGVTSATAAEAADVLGDEVLRLRGLVAEWEQRAEVRQQRIIKLTFERNAYRKVVDRIDPAAGHRIAKEFEERQEEPTP